VRAYWTLLILSVLAVGLGARWIQSPGYMDADYYMATGQTLAGGLGLQEPFLWNYLNEPADLPQPSHQYWMPLASFLAAFGMRLFGLHFRAGQVIFLAMAAFMPLVVCSLAHRLGVERRGMWLAGGLAVGSGFYFPYFLTSDTFALYALLGAAWMLAVMRAKEEGAKAWLMVGLISGLAHLSRADGVLFFLSSAAFLLVGRRWRAVLALAVGYVLVMGPWMGRNWSQLGTLLPQGTARGLWLLRYEELFSYPASQLTAQRWWASGIGQILKARLAALGWNILSFVAVNGMVFLGPLMAWGAWRKRKHTLVRLGAIYLLLLVVVMSFLFPFAGRRGGFFHSSAALMPLLWSLTPIGLEAFVDWGTRRRDWRADRAWRVFAGGALGLALLMTGLIYQRRVVGPDPSRPRWSASDRAYHAAGQWLAAQGAANARVAVNNPPGYYIATGMPALVLPHGGLEALASVVKDYQVSWVLIDGNNPGLADLYRGREQVGWLEREDTLSGEGWGPLVIFWVRREKLP
jgi:hypothetical protein